MKIKALLTFIIVLTLLVGTKEKINAQDIDIGAILEPGLQDANSYMEQYTRPAILSFANGMANGWYNTAKPHKTLGVDLTFSLNTATVPDSEKSFDFNNVIWENLQLQTGSSSTLPTLVGGETSSVIVIPAGTEITNPQTGESITYDASQSFNALNGFDLDDSPIAGVPVPTLQLGVGLVKNTDLKLRWIPEQNFDDFSISLFGLGVLHDVKQWIPGIKLVPIDISAFLGFTTFTSEFNIDITGDPNFSGSGLAEFKANSTTFQVLASKKLLFFTPYVGLGFNAVGSELNINGNYTFTETSTNSSLQITDPVALEFSDGGGGRFTIGGRLKLLVLTLHADYTVQQYNTFTFGLGISVR